MTKPFVEISNLSFSHESGKSVFADIDIVIPTGKITAILGPSGTGKTTLLRLIGGQLRPTQGDIRVAGQPIHRLSHSALYALRKRMGMLFQAGGLFTHLTVFENVAFPLREHTQLTESMIRTLTLLKLQMVGLRGAHALMPSELSGGMGRRVALARAIALDPALILYDEPFTGQDPISLGVLMTLIQTVNRALGATSVIVSHDVQETLSFVDYAYVIVNQTIVAHGTPAELKQNSDLRLQQFIQGLPDGPVSFDYPANTLTADFITQPGEGRSV